MLNNLPINTSFGLASLELLPAVLHPGHVAMNKTCSFLAGGLRSSENDKGKLDSRGALSAITKNKVSRGWALAQENRWRQKQGALVGAAGRWALGEGH